MARKYFTPKTFAFLRDLEANNDRTWFKARKDVYDSVIKEPALDFIEDFAPYLERISRHFVARKSFRLRSSIRGWSGSKPLGGRFSLSPSWLQ